MVPLVGIVQTLRFLHHSSGRASTQNIMSDLPFDSVTVLSNEQLWPTCVSCASLLYGSVPLALVLVSFLCQSKHWATMKVWCTFESETHRHVTLTVNHSDEAPVVTERIMKHICLQIHLEQHK